MALHGELSPGRGHVARALTAGDVEAWLRVLDANDDARREDLPDVVRSCVGRAPAVRR